MADSIITDEIVEKAEGAMRQCPCNASLNRLARAALESAAPAIERAALERGGTQAATDVLAERERQKSEEGWTPEHDDEHEYGDMALAAAAYASGASARGKQGDVMVGRRNAWWRAGWFDLQKLLWPWDLEWWKPSSPRRDLVKAGALILAEIERLDRAAILSAAPAIERAALERAAKVAESMIQPGFEDPDNEDHEIPFVQNVRSRRIAAAIRALAGKDDAT